MQRLSVVVLERDERMVLRGLGLLGAIHLVRSEAGPDTAPQAPPDRTEDLRRADALLARVDKLVRDLELADLPPQDAAQDFGTDLPPMGLQEIEKSLAPLEGQAAQVFQSRTAALQRWARVTTLLEQVGAYEGLDLSLEQIGRFSFLHFAMGSLPEEHFEAFERKVGPNVILLLLGEEGGRRRLVAVTSRKGRFALETALENAGFQHEVILEPAAGTMKQVLAEARREKAELGQELARPREALEALRHELASPLARLRAAADVERRILDAEQNFPRTDATVLITGWIPKADVPQVRHCLQDLVGGRCVVEAKDPGDVPEDQIPVLLRHPRLLRPFEMLVVGYGLPGYRELEPTLFVAITFLVMFGIMFGDVGHGGVLVLGGLATLVAARREKVRDVGMLLLLAGASSVGFGLVYGEYFGMRGWGLWYNPLEEGKTMELLADSIVIGVVIISLGLILNIINRFRRGDIVGGFLDKFGVVGAVFYWGVLALLMKILVYHEVDLHWIEVALLVVLPALALLLMALKEPIAYALRRRAGGAVHGDSLLLASVESVVEVFEGVLGYMANTISFVRLAAYAMSHAALLAATFLMAREVSRLVGGGGLGSAMGVVVVILGNILTILLEGIIASVQAIRLQYYEFFGKFFSGSGRAFRPFRLAERDAGSSPQP
jgi:V/A-type H+-transporting ATPase subunit I